jgi:adenylate cyclase
MKAHKPDRRLAAIVAADVVGYSRLMEVDEAGTLARLKTVQLELIDPAVARCKGRIIKTMGDGMLIEFQSVTEALCCAVDFQERMARRNRDMPASRSLLYRIGINLGDVIVDESDIFGDGVNVAARLESIAEPGGICISAAVHDQVGERLEVAYEDLGEQKVKNIAQPVRAFKVRIGAAPPEPELDPGEDTPDSQGDAALLGENIEVQLALWDAIKDSDDASEFEVYLERYPEGPFAELAKSRHDALVAAQSEKPHHEPKTGEEELSVELAFWEAAKDSSNPAELEAYLERYPKGEFAALAEPRLEALREAGQGDDERHPEEVEVEVAFWESIKNSKNPAMFKAYLKKYPEGSFASLARIMLDEFST